MKHGRYDVVIIGGGIAGLQASICAGSCGLKVLVLEGKHFGGQQKYAFLVENLIGYPEGYSGKDFIKIAVKQAKKFKVEFLQDFAKKVAKDRWDNKIVRTTTGQTIYTKTVLLAMGVSQKHEPILDDSGLVGKTVFYGCNHSHIKGLKGGNVVVIGGANSAAQAALHLSKHAQVYVMVRADKASKGMSQYLIDNIEKTNGRVQIVTNAQLVGITKDNIDFNIASKGVLSIGYERVFTFIGHQPNTEWLQDTINRDKDGFLLPNYIMESLYPARLNLETNMRGVFVCGDVRSGSIKSVSVSIGEASIAVNAINKYLATECSI